MIGVQCSSTIHKLINKDRIFKVRLMYTDDYINDYKVTRYNKIQTGQLICFIVSYDALGSI